MKRLTLAIVLAFVLSSLSAVETRAQTSQSFSINTTADGADINVGDGVCDASASDGLQCTLRAAIQEGNDFAGETFISVNNAGGPMGLSVAGVSENAAATGDLDITGNIRISGPGSVDGNDIDRVFHIHSGGQLELLSVNVVDGASPAGENGGGFLVSGQGSVLTFNFGEISANTSAARGGGLRIDDGGLAKIRSASISNNSADDPGGGLSVRRAGLILRNSTIYNNTVTSGSGGGIAVDNASADVSVPSSMKFAVLNNVTIANNAVTSFGGGLANFKDISPIVSNTVFSLNTVGGNATANAAQCGFSNSGDDNATAALLSSGHNLVTEDLGCTGLIIGGVGTDIEGVASLAAAAAFNGITHLKPSSTASNVVNAGSPTSCEPGDAIGNLRPQGSGCDIGAVELAVGFVGSIVATPIVPLNSTITVTVTDPDLRFQSQIEITAITRLNDIVIDSETLTLVNVAFDEIFIGVFPVEFKSNPINENGVLELPGEGYARFTYNDTPNGSSESGSTLRTVDTQIAGFQSDIVANSSFETDLNNDKRPDGWTAAGLSGDKMKCNKPGKVIAIDGECAFMMKNSVGSISQTLALPLPVGIDDDMFLDVLVDTNVARPGVIAKIVIKESDGDKETCKITLMAGTNAGEGGYQSFQCNVEPDLEEITKVKITISTTGVGGGKVMFDRVSLLTIVPRERAAGTRGVLPPPAAPEGFRR